VFRADIRTGKKDLADSEALAMAVLILKKYLQLLLKSDTHHGQLLNGNAV